MHYMAWKLERPLITVSCHDDLTASDLVGRYLIRGGETVWIDGPLTAAVKAGAFCYLDEIVEARKDTIVVIHPLADDRRMLPVEKKGELLKAPPEFLLALSYNPGYQSVLKDLKQSTRQRFLALELLYPERDQRSRDRDARVGRERGPGPDAREPCREDAEPEGPGPGGRREHAAAHQCGQARCRRDRPADGLRDGDRRAADRRPGDAGVAQGDHQFACSEAN